MTLQEKIQANLTEAQKAKDEEKTTILRSLNAAIKNEEIAKRPEELKEEDVLTVLKREVKKLNDAIVEFEKAGRGDLKEQYKKEAEVLKEYLPEEMSEEEIRKIVKEKVSASEDDNFGKIMKEVMAETKGQADGGTVSRIVKEELS